MKYIRTKDRIIKKEEKEQEYNGLHYFLSYDMNKSDYEYYEEDIIAQADTIEDLCDEFVVEDRDEFAIFHNLKLAKQTKGVVYGAIWTDKGLIYVAKMNDKGELELL